MNPDQPSREQIEARLTALLLGELPAAEAELLRWTISQDPELQKLHNQLAATIGFMREAMKNPTGAPLDKEVPLKLPQEQRQTLLAHFKTARPRPQRNSFWLRRIEIPSLYSLAIAAIVVFMICGVVAISIPNFVKARSTSQSNAIINNLRQIDAAKNEWALEKKKSADAVPTPNDLTPYLEGQTMRSVAGENYVLGKVSEPTAAKMNGKVLTAMAPNSPLSVSERSVTLNVRQGSTAADEWDLETRNARHDVPGVAGGERSVDRNPQEPKVSPQVQIALPDTEHSLAESEQNDTNVYSQNVVGYAATPVSNQLEPASKTGMQGFDFSSGTSAPRVVGWETTFGPPVALYAAPRSTSGANTPEITKSVLPSSAPPIPAGGTYNLATAGDQPQVIEQIPRKSEEINYGISTASASPVANSPKRASEGFSGASGSTREINGTTSFGGTGPIVAGAGSSGNWRFQTQTNFLSDEMALNDSAKDKAFANRLQNALAYVTNGTPWAAQYFNLPEGSSSSYVTNAIALGGQSPSTMVEIASAGPQWAWSANDMHLKVGNIGMADGSAKQQYAQKEQQSDELQGKARIMEAPKSVKEADIPLRSPPPNAPIPQPEIQTTDNAFSTFSMNVSDVSFKLAMASLEKGRMPDPASIRSEEFINAFDYHDPEPLQGEPLAFAYERAGDPFAQERDLLRFSIKAAAAGRQDGRALNIVLLLDTSGSMERADRVAIIREALRVLSSQLQPQDVVSVVSFARTARLWADGIPGSEAGATLDKVGGITPEGGTNLEEAMRLAYETALHHFIAGGMNRVVLLTDGAANLGNVDPQVLTQKVESERRQGIALDCFGIGWDDYNDDLLEQLSSNGDGRYAFINSPDEAKTEFAAKLAGALQVAAEDVKVQVEFNPNRVTAWRQIGYAKHQLTKEQFRDNSVAAGAIAAREAGNALYVIETKPDGEGPIATVRVRYRIPGTQDNRERSWLVEYTGAAPELAQSSPPMRLAASAAEISEWMAESPFAQEVTPDALLNYLSGVPQFYGTDERPKQLESMIREAKSVSGK